MTSRPPVFNWTAYLYVAQELAGVAGQPPTEEARLRSTVSRAYYAVFIQARNHLRDVEGQQVPMQNVHQYVIHKFRSSSDRKRKSIGWDLATLRGMRSSADYQDHIYNLPAMVRTSLRLAPSIIRRIQNL